MAKNNLKTLNNNGSSLNSTSQIYSKYSNTFNTYLYFNVIQMTYLFNDRVTFNDLKIKSILNYETFFFFKNFNFNKFKFKPKYLLFTDIKFFFINGHYSYVFDYYNLKELTKINRNTNIRNLYKSLTLLAKNC